MKLDELENTLLDQIEKLNDDSLADDPEKALKAVYFFCNSRKFQEIG